MQGTYTTEELHAFGFREVGEGVVASRDARFFAIDGVLGDHVRIDAFTVLTGEIHLGDHVHISPFSFLSGTGGRIEMHARSGVSSRVTIYTKSADYTAQDLATAEKVTGGVTIGKNTIIGTGTTIMPGVTIGRDASVSSNSVVGKDLEAGSIVINRGLGLVTLSQRTPTDD